MAARVMIFVDGKYYPVGVATGAAGFLRGGSSIRASRTLRDSMDCPMPLVANVGCMYSVNSVVNLIGPNGDGFCWDSCKIKDCPAYREMRGE